MKLIKTIYACIAETLKLFIKNDATRMSAALSFYTFFALAPVFLIVIYTTGLFLHNNSVEVGLYHQLNQFIGADAVLQVQEIVKNSGNIHFNSFTSIISIGALLFSATGVFTEIQSSLNSIWQLKAKPKKSWLKYITNRFISLSVIISLGFILLVSLFVSTLADIAFSKLSFYFSNGTLVFSTIINFLITFIIISIIFGMIFKFLPDAKVEWKDIIASSILTALLFIIGKFLISYYIGRVKPTQPYGTAGSIVIILLWVYYSSIILYFGACFTKVFAQLMGRNIYPDDYAVFVEQVEITNKNSLQHQEEKVEVKKKDVAIVIDSSNNSTTT